MKRVPFLSGWSVSEKVAAFEGRPVPPPVAQITLPHDAIRDLERREDSDQGVASGFYPGGVFVYSKSFEVPADWAERAVYLAFEGVYRDAVVAVNGEYITHHPGGYSEFTVSLDPYLRFGETNTVTVDARAHRDSRWYSGAGIYRPVHLILGNPVHLALDGSRVRTLDADSDRAVIEVASRVENGSRHTSVARVEWSVTGPDGAEVAVATSPVTTLPHEDAIARVRLAVDKPQLWHPETPSRYRLRIRLTDDAGTTLDEDETPFGIRVVRVDPIRGLRINGTPILLRGACVHHDSGVLGAATFSDAEERRVRLLKEAGFNAIRSSHNPLSRAMLEACDQLGMLVVDELTDVWTVAKTVSDAALSFPETWREEIASMVAKDYNSPSVIMYSIGNEIPEIGTPIGSTWSRRLAEEVRAIDDTRLVTNGLNGIIANMSRLGEIDGVDPDPSGDPNTVMAGMGARMALVNRSELVSRTTEESAAVLDVVGFNYSESRYELDGTLFPHRILLGSETFPQAIPTLWEKVRRLPYLIGDFTWTGWDYIGEAGVGRIDDITVEGYVQTGAMGPFPFLLAGSGDIDITGFRRPVSYYREIVFGLRTDPYIAVHRPRLHGRTLVGTPWSWDDVVSSWTWDAQPGAPITVDVYADADTVQLEIDGVRQAPVDVGVERPFMARIETAYQPGHLVAIARRDGVEVGRVALRTGAPEDARLVAHAERPVIPWHPQAIGFVPIALEDASGTLLSDADRQVTISVEGVGVLAGLGSGRICTTEPFGGNKCTTYDGRALAVIRPIGIGKILVTVSSAGMESASFDIDIVQAGPAEDGGVGLSPE